MRIITIILVILFSSSLSAQSSEIIQFNNGEIADADDVNSNFNILDKRVQALEADNTVSTSSQSCSNESMSGRWSILMGADPSESTLCLAYFEGSTWLNDQGSCTTFGNDGSQVNEKPLSANFSVDSSCRVTIQVVSDEDNTETGFGWMAADGSTINGITQGSGDNMVLTWKAIKLD